MAPEPTIRIELVYARQDAQDIVAIDLPAGATVKDALGASGLAARHPEIATMPLAVGIYGRSVPLDTVLHEGDRVEIYRPLLADPKEGRRRRAASRS